MKNIVDGGFIDLLDRLDLNVRELMDGRFGGTRRSKAYGSSPNFADFREYQPGDDLRRIDWNLYGRFEKLYLRLYEDERQLHHHIYIDCSASMDWGTPEKSWYALRMAVALSYLGVSAMDRVSVFLLRGGECLPLMKEERTIVGRDAFYRAAEAMNRVQFSGEADIGEAVTSNPDKARGGGISYIISDFMTDSDWKAAAEQLRSNRRETVLIQVLARDELTPELSGKLMLLDSETEDEEDERNMRKEMTRSAFKAYAAALEWHQNDIHEFCASRQISFITTVTDIPIEKLLYREAATAGIIK